MIFIPQKVTFVRRKKRTEPKNPQIMPLQLSINRKNVILNSMTKENEPKKKTKSKTVKTTSRKTDTASKKRTNAEPKKPKQTKKTQPARPSASV